jgi:NAD(P)-dependent dehydrogenase (short-subunit alcohol dehydrogenase family)
MHLGLGGPGQAVVVQADNGDPQTPDRLINEARRAFGRLDGRSSASAGHRPEECSPSPTSSGSRATRCASSVR